jgi:hypothetical protein
LTFEKLRLLRCLVQFGIVSAKVSLFPLAKLTSGTDYAPQDHALMGDEAAERQITHLADSTIILTDIFHTKKGQS